MLQSIKLISKLIANQLTEWKTADNECCREQSETDIKCEQKTGDCFAQPRSSSVHQEHRLSGCCGCRL